MLLVDRNSPGLQDTSKRTPNEIFMSHKLYVGIPCPRLKSIHDTVKTNILVYIVYVPAYTSICMCTHTHTIISCKFLLFAFISKAIFNRRCNIIEASAGEAMIQPRSRKVNYTVGAGDDN